MKNFRIPIKGEIRAIVNVEANSLTEAVDTIIAEGKIDLTKAELDYHEVYEFFAEWDDCMETTIELNKTNNHEEI